MKAAILILVVAVYGREATCHPDAVRHVTAAQGNVGIYGGHNISIEQAPHMASVRGYHGAYHFQFHVCGATIVDERFVLTSASCIDPVVEHKILVGSDQRNGNGGDLIDIKSYNRHPRYNKDTGNFDFCLIELQKPVAFSAKVAKINLPSGDLALPTGTWVNVTGWGRTESKLTSLELEEVEIPTMDTKVCQELYDASQITITQYMICAGYPSHGTCDSDKGGPLTLGNVLVGVATKYTGCGDQPGVFSRVSSAKDWILETIRK